MFDADISQELPQPLALGKVNRHKNFFYLAVAVHDYRFETVKARPFEVPPTKSVPSAYTNPPPVYQSQQVDYDQLDSPGAQTQSRTFKILQGLMENEVEPPPCALTPGYTPVAGNHDDQPPAPSIVHKQYNTPMTLYSQKNISETVKIDGMSLNDKDGDDDEPKSYLSSSVMQMVKEMDEEDNRVKTGKPTKYNALGHRKPDGRGVENPFSQASMSYKAYARKFAPFGGSTAIEDERELQEKREREEQRASQSDFYSSNQSVEPTNGADDFVAQSEPRAGVFGLPPPRSAAYEKMKEEQANKFPTARVRVFMPQSYNCPVGLYSPQNVVHTFQDQAEQVIGAMESQDQAGDGALPDGDDL
ncbi:hypothetical protein LSAT2_030934 [Lamellibrachia satsuma]|nr:hypothetical protein LSAT2_030934 [Lamellibrachia satsuma]